MSGLVSYTSSEDENDVEDKRPTKIAKTEATVSHEHHDPRTSGSIPPPTVGPSAPPPPNDKDEDEDEDDNPPIDTSPASTPASPYTTEREALRTLTMPTHPNFNIPASPSPPPPQNNEAAAALAATTKKFDRFLALKKQGVHFNDRLAASASLRNPSLLPTLLDFAGVGAGDVYASTLSGGGGCVPVAWPREWYVEGLMREDERRGKKAKGARTEVEFVRAGGGEGTRSGASSKAGTPGAGSGSEHRKRKFERR